MSSYMNYLRSLVDVSGELGSFEEAANAMRLANCLLLNGNVREATEYLNDIVYLEYTEKTEEQWTWNVFGIAILSELAYETEAFGSEKYYSVLRSNTWLPNDSLSYSSKVLSNHRGTMKLLDQFSSDDKEEHHSICEELCDELLELRYIYEYFFMARTPSFFVKYKLRGIFKAKSETAMELVKQMRIG